MRILLASLIDTYAIAVLWIAGTVLVLFTLYVGAAVLVGLLHPDREVRAGARRILHDLLQVMKGWLR